MEAVKALTGDGLFIGQSKEFFALPNQLAQQGTGLACPGSLTLALAFGEERGRARL